MPSKPAFDLAAIRKLVRKRVDETSLRATADDIGVSKSGLDSFLKGRAPYSRSRTKLNVWYLRERNTPGAVTSAEVDAAIAVLERYMDSANADSARRRRVREVTDRLFKAGEPRPRDGHSNE